MDFMEGSPDPSELWAESDPFFFKRQISVPGQDPSNPQAHPDALGSETAYFEQANTQIPEVPNLDLEVPRSASPKVDKEPEFRVAFPEPENRVTISEPATQVTISEPANQVTIPEPPDDESVDYQAEWVVDPGLLPNWQGNVDEPGKRTPEARRNLERQCDGDWKRLTDLSGPVDLSGHLETGDSGGNGAGIGGDDGTESRSPLQRAEETVNAVDSGYQSLGEDFEPFLKEFLEELRPLELNTPEVRPEQLKWTPSDEGEQPPPSQSTPSASSTPTEPESHCDLPCTSTAASSSESTPSTSGITPKGKKTARKRKGADDGATETPRKRVKTEKPTKRPKKTPAERQEYKEGRRKRNNEACTRYREKKKNTAEELKLRRNFQNDRNERLREKSDILTDKSLDRKRQIEELNGWGPLTDEQWRNLITAFRRKELE